MIKTLRTTETPLNIGLTEIVVVYPESYKTYMVHPVTAVLESVLKYYEIRRTGVRHTHRGKKGLAAATL